MRTVREAELSLLQHRVRNAALLLLVTFALGIVGYKLVGGAEHTWLEAGYMATITLTITGLRDIIPTNTPTAESFKLSAFMNGFGFPGEIARDHRLGHIGQIADLAADPR